MDLQSIAATTKTVPFCGGTVDVKGLSLRATTHLISEFPGLLALASGKADLASLIVSGPDAALAILSQGVVNAHDSRALLEAFEQASLGQQMDLLSVIVDLTFVGDSARPFLAAIVGRAEPPPRAPVATSVKTSPPPSDT